MFGGMVNNLVTDELWSYDITDSVWETHVPTSGVALSAVGHTAHIIDGIMYVIFGHSPVFGYLNTVQECNMCK